MSEFSTLDALSAAMEAAYTADHPRRALHDEQVRRKVALQSIDESLSGGHSRHFRPTRSNFWNCSSVIGASSK